MHPLSTAALCLVLAVSASAVQDARPRPPMPGGPGRKEKQRVEPLVKLPDDFVQAVRVPGGGRAPRIAHAGDTLAVLAHVGEGDQGELVIALSQDEGATFGEPARLGPGGVRLEEGMHSGALDAGPDGRFHVAWIAGTPGVLCYAAVSPEGVPGPTVELGSPAGLCSTTAVAVDAAGKILLFYVAAGDAAAEPDAARVQPGLRVWLQKCADGATFDAPVAIDKADNDVSGGCALAAHVDDELGTIFVLYRCAALSKPGAETLTRDVRLLASEDQGATFSGALVENWKLQRDPRTTASLVQDPGTTLAVWESRGTVLWTPLKRHEMRPQLPTEVRDLQRELLRTRPAGAAGEAEVLLAWLERPRGEDGGPAHIAWRAWQRDPRIPLGDGAVASSEGASAPAVFARKGGGFTILY